MSEPWFEAARYAWIPGTAMGLFGATIGTLGGVYAPRGQLRTLVLGLMYSAVALSAASCALCLVAFMAGQPWSIWYLFGLPGVLGVCIFGPMIPVIRGVYQAAEARRIEAANLK